MSAELRAQLSRVLTAIRRGGGSVRRDASLSDWADFYRVDGHRAIWGIKERAEDIAILYHNGSMKAVGA